MTDRAGGDDAEAPGPDGPAPFVARIGPAASDGATSGPDGGLAPDVEPEWEPGSAGGWEPPPSPHPAVARATAGPYPGAPPIPEDALPVATVFAVGDGRADHTDPADPGSDSATAPGRALGWVRAHRSAGAGLVAAVAVVVAVAVAATVVARRDDGPRYRPVDGYLVPDQAGPTDRPDEQWQADPGCEPDDLMGSGDVIRLSPGCELAADAQQAYVLVRTVGAGATLTAYDGTTGRTAWRIEVVQETAHVQAFAGLVFIATYGPGIDTVIAYDPRTGTERWRAEGSVLPLGDAGALIVSRSRSGDRPDRLAAVSLVDGTDRWERPGLELAGLCRGTVYGVGRDTWVALDLATGAERWRRPRGIDDWLSCRGDALVTLEHDDELRSLDPTDGAVRWRLDVPDAGELTVLDDTILIGSGEDLVALDPSDGARRWATPLTELREVHGWRAFEDGLAVGSGQGSVHLLDLADGTIVRQRPLDLVFQVGLPQGVVYTLVGQRLHAYDLDDLDDRWDVAVDTRAASFALGGGRIFVLGPGGLTAYG